MERSRYRYIHIQISLALFVLCLLLPGFYVKEVREPLISASLLVIGWLGPLDGHFSWFANLFYLVGLLKFKKPNISSGLGVIALVFALSFLVYREIIVSEATAHADITGYGWGYFLWVASIGTFSIGQLLLVIFENKEGGGSKTTFAVQSSWFVIVLGMFLFHHYLSEGSQYSIEKRRKTIFEEKCALAEQHIYTEANDTNGIFLDPDWGWNVRRKINSKVWYHNVGVLGLRGFIQFREKRNAHPSSTESGRSLPYRKYMAGDHKGIETDSLESDYAVITRFFDIPKELNIHGAEITIKKLKDDSIVAKTTYVFDLSKRKFCGHAPSGYFSVSGFIIDSLNLTKK